MMKRPAYIFIAIFTLVGVVSVMNYVFAAQAEDQFIVSQQIINAADTIAPSTPTNLVATPISSSQIDLSWTASTDNNMVSGYQVFRDSSFIATSTLTTYSDTGLTPETLYEYYVVAFDPSFNFSSPSATTSTTTLAVPVVTPPTDEGSSSGSISLVLLQLSVEPGFDAAVLNFETNLYTQAVISWGLTPDYELGTLAQQVFAQKHTAVIEGLTPDTTYFYKIQLTDPQGRTLLIDNQQFKTLKPFTVPANVTNLQAVGHEKDITLTWNNPAINFDSVRIVRSDKFYPTDLFDGKVVYEGPAEKFVDTDVVDGTIYYYTVFTKDIFGNYSSGAVTKARLHKPGEPAQPDDLFGNVTELPRGQVHPLIAALTLLDLDFFQSGKKVEVINGVVHLEGDLGFIVSLDYNKVPEILKTIVITMRDPDEPTKTFSFLLRVNKDKTAYEAFIAPLGRSGNFQFGVSILDYKNQGLKKLSGLIVAAMPALALQSGFFEMIAAWFGRNFLWILLLLLALCIGYTLARKKGREKKQNEFIN